MEKYIIFRKTKSRELQDVSSPQANQIYRFSTIPNTFLCVCMCVCMYLNEPILKCLWNNKQPQKCRPSRIIPRRKAYPPDCRKFHEVTVTQIVVPEFHSKV